MLIVASGFMGQASWRNHMRQAAFTRRLIQADSVAKPLSNVPVVG